LIAFHSVVLHKSGELPSAPPDSLEVEYILWATTYASALITAAMYDKAVLFLRSVLSLVDKHSSGTLLSFNLLAGTNHLIGETYEAVLSYVTTLLGIANIQSGDFCAAVPHFTKAVSFPPPPLAVPGSVSSKHL
jgi:hypothetical protein